MGGYMIIKLGCVCYLTPSQLSRPQSFLPCPMVNQPTFFLSQYDLKIKYFRLIVRIPQKIFFFLQLFFLP